MGTHRLKLLRMSFFFLALIIPPVFAALNRPFDPIVIVNLPKGQNVPTMEILNGRPLNNIKLYAFHSGTGWSIMPFQIDEVPYFKDTGKVFDNDDEIVFLAQDCGDRVTSTQWIDDETSRLYPRFEVTVVDTTSDDSAFAYIYLTDIPDTHPQPLDYITYDSKRDRVISLYYELGARSIDTNGNYETLIIPTVAGGDSIDFLDRLKVRIKGYTPLLSKDINLSEENLERREAPRVINGCVRIIKNWTLTLNVMTGVSAELDPVALFYYPYFTEFAFNINKPIPEEYFRVDYARLSMDLDPDAKGMKMFSSLTPGWPERTWNGVTIDRVNDTGLLPRALAAPGWNWWMQTGSPGTILTVAFVSKIGSKQELYYKDSPSGTNDPVEMGTVDTGFDGSWGDTGMKFIGPGIKTPLVMAERFLFLGRNITPDSANVIARQTAAPLAVIISEPVTVPVELADFHANCSKQFVTVCWSTASETNNIGFTIQRKMEGREWQDLAFIKGAGTTSQPQAYAYKDEPKEFGILYYRLKQQDFDGKTEFSDAIRVTLQSPSHLELSQNYPNPFNPSTVINYRIPAKADGAVTLSIFDVLGRQVRILLNEVARPGYYQMVWDGCDEQGVAVPSGVYWCVLKSTTEIRTQKMLKLP
jgi:hypothetical protein